MCYGRGLGVRPESGPRQRRAVGGSRYYVPALRLFQRTSNIWATLNKLTLYSLSRVRCVFYFRNLLGAEHRSGLDYLP